MMERLPLTTRRTRLNKPRTRNSCFLPLSAVCVMFNVSWRGFWPEIMAHLAERSFVGTPKGKLGNPHEVPLLFPPAGLSTSAVGWGWGSMTLHSTPSLEPLSGCFLRIPSPFSFRVCTQSALGAFSAVRAECASARRAPDESEARMSRIAAPGCAGRAHAVSSGVEFVHHNARH